MVMISIGFDNYFCLVLVLILVLKKLLLGFGIVIGFETCYYWVLVLVLEVLVPFV